MDTNGICSKIDEYNEAIRMATIIMSLICIDFVEIFKFGNNSDVWLFSQEWKTDERVQTLSLFNLLETA